MNPTNKNKEEEKFNEMGHPHKSLPASLDKFTAYGKQEDKINSDTQTFLSDMQQS